MRLGSRRRGVVCGWTQGLPLMAILVAIWLGFDVAHASAQGDAAGRVSGPTPALNSPAPGGVGPGGASSGRAQGGAQGGAAGGEQTAVTVLGFVVAMGHAAGAAEVCQPAVAAVLRSCVERILPHWSAVSGQGTPSGRELAILPAVWYHAFVTAYEQQRSEKPPVSCREVQAELRKLRYEAVCGRSAPR